MFASRAAFSSASGSAGSTRAGKLSNGMTFAPLAKIGVPLTTKPNAPCLAIEGDGAQADGARLRVAVEGGGDGVERLRAIATGCQRCGAGWSAGSRPGFRPGERDGRLARLAAAVGTGDGGGERDLLRRVRDYGGVRGQARFGIVQRVLRDADMIEAGIVPRLQLDRAPDAVGDEAGTPVPAVLIFRLANIGLVCTPLGSSPNALSYSPGSGCASFSTIGWSVLIGLAIDTRNFVVAAFSSGFASARQRRWALSAVSSGWPLTVTVANVSSPSKHEVEVAVREHLRRDGQDFAILPRRQARPLDRAFIGADEGIGHAFSGGSGLPARCPARARRTSALPSDVP